MSCRQAFIHQRMLQYSQATQSGQSPEIVLLLVCSWQVLQRVVVVVTVCVLTLERYSLVSSGQEEAPGIVCENTFGGFTDDGGHQVLRGVYTKAALASSGATSCHQRTHGGSLSLYHGFADTLEAWAVLVVGHCDGSQPHPQQVLQNELGVVYV